MIFFRRPADDGGGVVRQMNVIRNYVDGCHYHVRAVAAVVGAAICRAAVGAKI